MPQRRVLNLDEPFAEDAASPLLRLRDDIAAITQPLFKLSAADFGLSHSPTVPKFAGDLQKSVEKFHQTLELARASVEGSLAPIRTLVAKWAEQEQLAEALEVAGWLPHETIPVELVRQHTHEEPAALEYAVGRYLADNWATVKQTLRRRFVESGIDQDAVATMDEALEAHSHGLYRAACRTVFPEIERVARQRLYRGRSQSRMTSLKELRQAILNLPASEMHPVGWWGFHVFCFVHEACYESVDPGSETKSTPPLMPNRHAISHGLRLHSTPRDSLNTLFIADFMFNAVHIVTKHAAEIDAHTIESPISNSARR